MQLTLKYNEQATHVLSGAFVRGNAPDEWLQEINAWQIPLEKLVCFIIAQNNNPANAAGLFVVFSKNQMPGLLQVRHPYTVLGKKLFIPVNAELSPAISEPELQSLLIWDCQVFHPTIGFIGFERSDRIDLFRLLQYQEPRNIYWGYAQPGQQPWMPLRQISVQQPTAQEVFDSFKEHMGGKPLTNIPTTNKKEVPGWLNNPIASELFKKGFSFLSKLSSLLPEGSVGASAGSSAGSEHVSSGQSKEGNKKPGWFNKVKNWMQEKIEDLEKQRESELKRLSDLFDKDTDEALQYAIPLNSPFEGRGATDQPSARLGKRSTEFNMNKLGGGQAIDNWNVDNYYDDLRAKYLKAAEKAIEAKDFKKAAYIYAHLLGDLSSAAATLRQGKLYRQAAALYKEHLNNLAMAATCYEEGGLLLEAIDMYTALGKHEKAGDLYKELDQQEPALACYEKCVAAAAQHKDYLEQSRIIIDKMEDAPRAKQVLLNGWNDVKQPEACLEKYFNLVADDNKEEIHSVIKTFHANNEAAKKEMVFLNVIDKVNRKYKTPELENACQGIAYEIVSEQVSAGNPDSLFALRNFVPNDELLTPDFYRFLHAVNNAPKQTPPPDKWQLKTDVHWKKVLVWNNQILIWGLDAYGLVLARMNWAGHKEYYSWSVLIKTGSSLLPIANAPHTNHIVVYDYNPALTDKHLPKNNHFQDSLHVFRPGFIDASTIGIGFFKNLIVVVQQLNGEGSLIYYTLEGKVITYNPCTFNNSTYNFSLAPAPVKELLWCGDKFYLSNGQVLLTISERGAINVLFHTEVPIHKVVVNQRQDGKVIVAIAMEDRVTILINNQWDENVKTYEIIETKVVDMTFLPGDRIAIVYEEAIQVYNVEDDLDPELQWLTRIEKGKMAVFPGLTRDQLGILESNGKITLHNMP